MTAPTRPALVRAAAVATGVVLGGILAAPAAMALGEVAATPKAVVPGGSVTVAGECPEPVNGAYVRATVGVDAIGRFVVVPVADGAFSAKFRARAVSGYDDPRPGDDLRAQVSCATEASFVANVGTVKVEVVDTVLGTDDLPVVASSTAAAKASATTTSKASAKSKASANSKAKASARAVAEAKASSTAVVATGAVKDDPPIAPWIPITAFAVAAFGTAGAYIVSRRSETRAEAMTGHPAQRGVAPRRDAR